MNQKTIPFDLRYHHYKVYVNNDGIDLVVSWPTGKHSHYVIDEAGSIVSQSHQLSIEPVEGREDEVYWHDYTSGSAINMVYTIVTKHNYSNIIQSMEFLAGFFSLEETKYEDTDMIHIDYISEAQSALKQLYLNTEDEGADAAYRGFSAFANKYFFDHIGSDSSIVWQEEDRQVLRGQFLKVAEFFKEHSEQ